jgi:AbrB family looped-hinge helix DNA binding protein
MGRIAGKVQLPYVHPVTTYLTVSSKGQVTLKKPVLAHLGVQPGQKVAIELRPDGGVELRPAPTGKISEAFGVLPPYEGPVVTIEEMNEVIARGWAGEL